MGAVRAATPSVLTAREFRLVDATGHTLALLAPAGKDGGRLQMMDAHGARGLELDGRPWIGFFNSGAPRANLGLGYGDDHGPAVWFSNPKHGYMKIQVENAGPVLRLTKEGGTEQVIGQQ